MISVRFAVQPQHRLLTVLVKAAIGDTWPISRCSDGRSYAGDNVCEETRARGGGSSHAVRAHARLCFVCVLGGGGRGVEERGAVSQGQAASTFERRLCFGGGLGSGERGAAPRVPYQRQRFSFHSEVSLSCSRLPLLRNASSNSAYYALSTTLNDISPRMRFTRV